MSDAVPDRVKKLARRLFALAVVTTIAWFLFRQLRALDWPLVLRSLPTSPWFYLCLTARYMLLPVTEVLCYSAAWSVNLFRHFGVFLVKRLMNSSVAGASGDAYFLVWAAQNLKIGYRSAFSAVKDVTLLSAAAANGVAVIVFGAYLAFGDRSVLDGVEPRVVALIVGVTLASAVLSVVIVGFRGKVLGVDTPTMRRILGFHTIRAGGNLVLLGLQWWAAIPEVSFGAWINLLVIQLVVSRTPFIPARELLFLSIALAMVNTIDAPAASLEAMFLVDAALIQLLAIPSLILATLWRSPPPKN
ncbi:MAG: hypothetical protein WBG86_09460 [Polyangiales bacterium]